MIKFDMKPGQKLLELGGGETRHPQATVMVDARPLPGVDFVADFEEPLPVQSDEFDGVYSAYCIEHVSYPKGTQFVSEMFRVLKPGGMLVLLSPNTQAQQAWIAMHPDGWDGKAFEVAASELLFGSQNYPENTHKAYFDAGVMERLLKGAGFVEVNVQPWNPRGTDLIATAKKPNRPGTVLETPEADVRVGVSGWDNLSALKQRPDQNIHLTPVRVEEPTPTMEVTGLRQVEPDVQGNAGGIVSEKDVIGIVAAGPKAGQMAVAPAGSKLEPTMSREEMFDKHYWNGGGKVGGYANDAFGGYRDFPVHEITAQHVLMRRPESVLELGAARGYVGKRIEDAGVRYRGLEISKHCYMTRCSDGVEQWDLCKTPWPFRKFDGSAEPAGLASLADRDVMPFDLAFSIAVFEHIPEEFLPGILAELKRCAKRGLHGVDFGSHDDGFDRTHCTLRDRAWWRQKFDEAGLQSHEIVNKEELEKGNYPPGYLSGDGKLKLNVGSYSTMFHRGWVNIDVHDLGGFAQQHGYAYVCHDVRNGLPYGTGSVDLITMVHMFEHLTYDEGLRFLKECRRVIKPGGAMRIQVPDTELLLRAYAHDHPLDSCQDHHGVSLSEFAEINDNVEHARTPARRLYELLGAGHLAYYDYETLADALQEAGFAPRPGRFRELPPADWRNYDALAQIKRETLDEFPGLTLYVDAVPQVS